MPTSKLPPRLFGMFLLAALPAPLAAQSVVPDFDVADTAFQGLFDLRSAQGYYLSGASTGTAQAGTRYQLVWQKAGSGHDSRTFHGLSASDYQNQVTTLGGQGYRPLLVDSYGTAPNENYLAVFLKDNTGWYARHAMTATDLKNELTAQAGKGYQPQWVGSSGPGNDPRYVAIWTQVAAKGRCEYGMTEATLASRIAFWKAQNYALACVSATDYAASTPTRFAAVWRQNASGAEYEAQTYNELTTKTAANLVTGLRPLAVAAYDTANGTRYVAGFQQDSSTPVLTQTGPTITSMSGFDAAMQSYMSTQGIDRGAIAVTRNGRLIYTQAYTSAAASAAPTDPQSLFRIASLSKALTAVGILKLFDQKKLNLDQKINTILDMTGWVDPQVQSVTVRHLLNHYGGWNPTTSFDPMFKDKDVNAEVKGTLPVDLKDIVDYMKKRNLDQAPGSGYAYSNFGYMLLGLIIEKVTGSSYEDFMLREVLLPIGASTMRVTDSSRGRQIPGEVDYDQPSSVDDVMGSSEKVEWPYGGWNIRNMAAHGGFVSSVIDYARFLAALDGQSSPLLSSAARQQMTKRPPWSTATSYWYGMGVGVMFGGLPTQVLEHDGSLDGTYAYMSKEPGGVNWVAFFNKRTSTSTTIANTIRAEIAKMLLWPAADLFPSYASVSAFAAGCAGKRGVPYIRPQAGSALRVGYPFTLEMTPIEPSAQNIPFLFLGVSNTSWNGLTLPVSLQFLGMDKCFLNISPDVRLPLANLGGVARLSSALPNNASLIGGFLFMQGMVTEPGANPLGALNTPGCRTQFGQ